MKKTPTTIHTTELDVESLTESVRGIFTLNFARMIYAGELDPNKSLNYEEFSALINKVGVDVDSALEIHIDDGPKKITLIKHCLDVSDKASAVVILCTLIESEINSIIRIVMRIKGFDHGVISQAIQGTDITTKLNVFLPLLELDLRGRMKQIAMEGFKIRNHIVHFKGKPDINYNDKSVLGDHRIIKEKCEKFFKNNPFDVIEKHLTTFSQETLIQNKEIQQAHHLYSSLMK